MLNAIEPADPLELGYAVAYKTVPHHFHHYKHILQWRPRVRTLCKLAGLCIKQGKS